MIVQFQALVSHRSLFTLLGILALMLLAPLRGAAQGQDNPAMQAVLVIPFTNVSGDPSDEWLGAGIAETITADLDQAQGLSVFALETLGELLAEGDRVGSGAIGENDGRAHGLAQRLGASWIVSGGFQRLGDQLRITARVVDVETGAITATAKVDGSLNSLFELEDRIVTELSGGFASLSREPASWEAAAEEAEIGSRAPRAGEGVIPDARRDLTGRVSVEPSRTQTPPTVDGRLDDDVWRDAARVTEFVQRNPVDGAPATERTEVFIAYDSANIYLGFYAHYQNPGIMRANRSDRDQAGRSDDIFSVYFDPFLDQQRAYVFSVNGYGVQGDSILGSRRGGGGFGGGGRGGFGGGIPRGDSSWDALFSSGGQIVEDGFTAEMAIPFKSLRYPTRGGAIPHTWGFQIVRSIRDKDEYIVWSPVSRDVAGFLTQMGVLSGMSGLSTSRNLELQPTFTAVRFGSLNEGTGRVVDGDPKPEGGINIKYGVTSNLTADFTLNPDFSQIESDRPQVEVNQRFALFFPENRPFFLEGAEIFQIPGPLTVLHTRTIVDPLYGAKLTGKSGDTTIGVLYANDEVAGAVDDPSDPTSGQVAQTFVGRVRYDLYAESFIGVIFTDREFVNSYSRLMGIDSNFRVGRTHSLTFKAMGTDHRDQEGIDTSGYLVDVSIRKSGRNLSYTAATYALSPEFKTDVGFVRRTDQRFMFATADYRWWPQHWLLSWGPDGRYSRNHSFDGVLQDEERRIGVNFNFPRNIGIYGAVNRDLERFGEVDFRKTRFNMFSRVGTSLVLSVGAGFNWGDEIYYDLVNPFLGHESGLRTFINFRPVSRFQSQININNSRFTDPMGLFIPGINTGDVSADGTVFDVKIFRALSTYQFSERLLLRNIAEINTFDQALGLNFLLTYRVNSGTVFYVGYDDRYRQREQFDDREIFPGSGYQQTNRAIFTKFQYLFRF